MRGKAPPAAVRTPAYTVGMVALKKAHAGVNDVAPGRGIMMNTAALPSLNVATRHFDGI